MTDYGERLARKIDDFETERKYLPVDVQDQTGLTVAEIELINQRQRQEVLRGISSTDNPGQTDLDKWRLDTEDPETADDSTIWQPSLSTPQSLVDLVMGHLKKPDLLVRSGQFGPGVYGIDGNNMQVVDGAYASFPPQDHESEALNFTRNAIWINLARTDKEVQVGPHLPYVIIGEHRGSEILTVPMTFNSSTNITAIAALLNHAEDQKGGLYAKFASKSKHSSKTRSGLGNLGATIGRTIADEVDWLMGKKSSSSGSMKKSGNSKSSRQSPKITEIKFSPLHMWRFKVNKKNLETIDEYRTSVPQPFTVKEARSLINGDRLVVDQDFTRSITNGGLDQRQFSLLNREPKTKVAPTVRLSDPTPVFELTDDIFDKFQIINNLARLAVSFGVADQIKKLASSR